MRIIVLFISIGYAIMFAWLWHDVTNSSNDAAGYGMATGFLTIGMYITGFFAGPAVILAVLGKWPKLALGLSLVPAALIALAAATDVI
ncbi:MAG: hypothetical protein ACU0BB_16040 [Paracoccaceae bacterium]